jgi:hypothetical protein
MSNSIVHFLLGVVAGIRARLYLELPELSTTVLWRMLCFHFNILHRNVLRILFVILFIFKFGFLGSVGSNVFSAYCTLILSSIDSPSSTLHYTTNKAYLLLCCIPMLYLFLKALVFPLTFLLEIDLVLQPLCLYQIPLSLRYM